MPWSYSRLKIVTLTATISVAVAAIAIAAPRDEDPRIETWAEDWPDYVEMYMKTKEMSQPTPFGGNYPYSKLIRYPGKTALWAGYAFAVDFNEDRGHYYSQIDQMETKRNDKEYLNANGLPNFGGQPGSCMNCHSGWAPVLADKMGCLRVNRQAFIDAMVARGYEADPVKGLKATPKAMRDYVCAQCHVEYYFKGKNAVLTYPWTEWPKGQPLRFEMIEAYYEKVRKLPGGFQQDWIHAVTKAPMVKMQHPEYEVVSSGVHARFMGCVDCHMPKTEWKGREVTDHTMGSPLNKLDNCLGCHNDMSADQMYQRIYDIQVDVNAAYLTSEKAILALIEDIAMVREAERESAITAELTDVLDHHRGASMRWDWIGASNSTGSHSSREAFRVLDQAVDLARDGQSLLVKVAAQHGIELVPTTDPTLPQAPDVINPESIVGSIPPAITRAADRRVIDRLKQYLDQPKQ